MGFMDKIKNRFDAAVGRAKASTGRAADDPYLESEGKRDQTKANLKQSGEHVKDAAVKAKQAMTGNRAHRRPGRSPR